ncbi:RHOMBOID-like protein 9, chloroplastic [Impatiens glandulifera]|uniref:RHOMBOID-like protein 9, chloroplastic n=1 Tax=Impatiens glandulifera TaxID=253017 RepID=UPI001FB129D1|nr:RHOMBOID-like protein 9, chloroplastic [Impatiens glandulifera]
MLKLENLKGDVGKSNEYKLKSYRNLRNNNFESGFQCSYDEASDLYVISILTSINIAVFLFEIASPIQNSDSELFFTLPSLYGAKVNDLIMTGEWWRLVIPMFLHSGILHIAHGFWVLLNFGPQVCKFYGSFTFFLIYVLGGISGNLTSFLQTPEPSVGGTGPVFAIIGAWFIYHIQNKDNILKDDLEIMFQKAMIATAIGSILSISGPIDNWTHLGAAFTGIIYGFFMLQMDHASPKTSQKEGIALVTPVANPWKSLLVFFIFIIGFFSLPFVVEPPLN